MNVRCPVCGAAIALAVGDTRLLCTACGLAAPVSHLGTMPGTPARAMLALETDLTGTTIAGRTLVERIGAGGMGTVYRARSGGGAAGGDGGAVGGDGGAAGGDGGGDVAVKVLRPGFGPERAAMLARFAREAEALRRLEHPRVVRFLDHGEDGDAAYIVTELVEGRDLAARLAAGPMALAEIVDVFGQVCDGVAAAHAAGIVHRDLKPANILVGAGGVKVADFGLAQLGGDVSVPTLTRTDVAMGTFHYLAPEQRKDARTVDHRADVWALGVILYEMMTGELPLGSFAPPSERRPDDYDRRADAIVRRALAPDPAERYASVSELARDVRALVARPRIARAWIAAAAAVAFAGATTAIAFALAPAGQVVASLDAGTTMHASTLQVDAGVEISSATIDSAIETPADAAPDAAIDAAAIAAAPPRPPAAGSATPVARPTAPIKVSARKPGAGKPGVDKVKADGGKAKKPDVEPPPAVCRTAQRCCLGVRGESCNAWLTSGEEACATALADFRTRATNPKQLRACGAK